MFSALGGLSGQGRAEELELGLPIACEIGRTCWVQQYVDHDPGKAARDYACGAQTYDGHTGTDFRIRDTAQRGVEVIAAAPGIVRGTRNDMPDLLIRSARDRGLIRNRECGNGLTIDHGGGWETQYCHLRVGSVKVRPGEEVARGDVLGEVGYSGDAGFPHVHLSVRKDGAIIDPFKPDAQAACGREQASLWVPEAQAALAYRPGEVIDLGFTTTLEGDALEQGVRPLGSPAADWPALVAYAWMINLRKGDEIRLTLAGPEGLEPAENVVRLDRNKAQYFLFSGRRRPQAGWPTGTYAARLSVTRDGKTVLSRDMRATLD